MNEAERGKKAIFDQDSNPPLPLGPPKTSKLIQIKMLSSSDRALPWRYVFFVSEGTDFCKVFIICEKIQFYLSRPAIF